MNSRRPRLASALLLSVASLGVQLVAEGSARADILVVAPHPDDDIITAAGVIYRARQAGTVVWVAYMTNGDYFSSSTATATEWGVSRANEAVDAQNSLGVPTDHLLFLGYPDGSLQGLYGNLSGAFTPPAGIAQSTMTYTRPGSVPYSQIRTGGPVAVNGNNVNADLVYMLQQIAPSDIFVVSPDDMHPDHSATALFVTDAVATRRAAAASYNPIIHYALVWDSTAKPIVWPLAPNPATFFSEPPLLTSKPDTLQIGYVWAERESLDVPLVMQDTDWVDNLKAQAIDDHDTQGGFTGARDDGHISSFVHKDEFFFPRRITGSARAAVASTDGPVPNAGLDQTAAVNASVQLSGSGSLPPSGRSLTYSWRQAEGPVVTLSGATTATPSFTVPASASGATLTFELRVNDGISTSIADAVSVRVSGTVPVDAGTPPPVDSGTPPPVDSGTPPPVDSGTPPLDAGAPPQDAGVRLDSGTPVDAGSSLDSGIQDASVAAATDSGSTLDAGTVDAATQNDATAVVADAAAWSDAMSDSALGAEVDSALQGAALRTSAWPGDEEAFDQDPSDLLHDDDATGDTSGGCSIAAAESPNEPAMLVLSALGLALMLRRRRAS